MSAEFAFPISGGTNFPLDLGKHSSDKKAQQNEAADQDYQEKVSQKGASYPTAERRTQIAANERFSFRSHSNSLPLSSRYHFKNWIDLMPIEFPYLHSRISGARYRALVRQIEIDQQQQCLIKCWAHLKENFHEFLDHLKEMRVIASKRVS